MTKKCIICGTAAYYKIKDTADFYCENCAEENFSDLDLLVKVEAEAQKLKELVKEQLELQQEELHDQDQ